MFEQSSMIGTTPGYNLEKRRKVEVSATEKVFIDGFIDEWYFFRCIRDVNRAVDEEGN